MLWELPGSWERLVIYRVNVAGAREMVQMEKKEKKKNMLDSVAGVNQGGTGNKRVSRSGNSPLPPGVYLYSFKAPVGRRVCFGSCPGLGRTFPASDPCGSRRLAWRGAWVGLESGLPGCRKRVGQLPNGVSWGPGRCHPELSPQGSALGRGRHESSSAEELRAGDSDVPGNGRYRETRPAQLGEAGLGVDDAAERWWIYCPDLVFPTFKTPSAGNRGASTECPQEAAVFGDKPPLLPSELLGAVSRALVWGGSRAPKTPSPAGISPKGSLWILVVATELGTATRTLELALR